MADEDEKENEIEELEDEVSEDEAASGKKMSGKKLVLFIVLPALLVLIAGGTGAFLLLGGGSDEAEVADVESKDDKSDEKKAASKDDSKKESAKDADYAKKDGDGADSGHVSIGGPGEPSFYTLPEMLVNLNGGNGRQVYLKLKLTLEVSDPGVFSQVDPILPRVLDQFQMFLRELRMEDLDGTAGQYRLRRELLRRVNLAIEPAYVDAVLIEEMLVQ